MEDEALKARLEKLADNEKKCFEDMLKEIGNEDKAAILDSFSKIDVLDLQYVNTIVTIISAKHISDLETVKAELKTAKDELASEKEKNKNEPVVAITTDTAVVTDTVTVVESAVIPVVAVNSKVVNDAGGPNVVGVVVPVVVPDTAIVARTIKDRFTITKK